MSGPSVPQAVSGPQKWPVLLSSLRGGVGAVRGHPPSGRTPQYDQLRGKVQQTTVRDSTIQFKSNVVISLVFLLHVKRWWTLVWLFDSLDSFSEFLEPRWVFIPTRTRITPRGTKIHLRTKWQLLRKLRTKPYPLVKSVFSWKIIVHEHLTKIWCIWKFFQYLMFFQNQTFCLTWFSFVLGI